MISDIVFYIIVSSTILIYGVGLNRAAVFSQSPRQSVFKFLKMLLTVSSSSVLSYLFSTKLLLKAGINEVYPLAALLIFIVIAVSIESIVRITAHTTTAEFAMSYLFVLIGTGESISLLECLLISCLGCISFFLFVSLLVAIRHRTGAKEKNNRDFMLVYISISIVILITLSWNISWLNPKVF